MPFLGLETHTFCYPDKCPKPVRLEETSNSPLASEFIIMDAKKYLPEISVEILWICYSKYPAVKYEAIVGCGFMSIMISSV